MRFLPGHFLVSHTICGTRNRVGGAEPPRRRSPSFLAQGQVHVAGDCAPPIPTPGSWHHRQHVAPSYCSQQCLGRGGGVEEWSPPTTWAQTQVSTFGGTAASPIRKLHGSEPWFLATAVHQGRN